MLIPLGVRVIEDDVWKKLGGNAGNLICLPPAFDPSKPAIVLAAHLDTVESTEKLRPVVKDGKISSDGSTILGGDDRLGVAVLVDLLLKVADGKMKTRNFFVVFSIAEELGLLGAKTIDLSSYKIEGLYTFDSSRRPGIYIRDCVGLSLFKATFVGKASHAGVAPEDGINAIQLAARGIANIEMGRVEPELTVNIGKIVGGGATNIVPDKVIVDGEVRAFFPKKIEERLRLIRESFERSMNGSGKLIFEAQTDFEPYILDPELPMLRLLEDAMRKSGLTPQPIRYTGGSDANMYNAKGIPATNVGTGAQKPHSTEEFLLVEDLVSSAKLAYALVTV
jgi:tripeptide aminopeptidase